MVNVWIRIGILLTDRWDPSAWARDALGNPTRDLNQPLSRLSTLAAIYLEADDVFDAHQLSEEFLDVLKEFGYTRSFADGEDEISFFTLNDILIHLSESEVDVPC